MQSGLDSFDRSGLIMIFLTSLGVTGIKYSFRLVPEEKAVEEIPKPSRLEYLEKFSASNFALSYAEDNTSGPLVQPCMEWILIKNKRKSWLMAASYQAKYLEQNREIQ